MEKGKIIKCSIDGKLSKFTITKILAKENDKCCRDAQYWSEKSVLQTTNGKYILKIRYIMPGKTITNHFVFHSLQSLVERLDPLGVMEKSIKEQLGLDPNE